MLDWHSCQICYPLEIKILLLLSLDPRFYIVKLGFVEQRYTFTSSLLHHFSRLMKLWYLSLRRPAKAQSSMRIRAVSPEPSLFVHGMKYGSRRSVLPKIRHLAPLMAAHVRLKNELT